MSYPGVKFWGARSYVRFSKQETTWTATRPHSRRQRIVSAVFGFLNRDGQPAKRVELDRMCEAMKIHGPDDYGLWHEGCAAIGFRLSRFTPEDDCENQPLRDDEAQVVLVSDARLDNRTELRELLDISSSEAASLADSQFILRAYRKWGRDCASHLCGSFAFAIYERKDHRLFLARSPRGERPLVYHSTRSRFAFSTMPKGLFALSSVPRDLNRRRLADFLIRFKHEPESTFYEGICKLPQGCWMEVSPAGVTSYRYWRPMAQKELRFKKDSEYVDAFNSLFERVVNDSLRSVTPISTMLSGGLDSTAISAVAARRLSDGGGTLFAFTEVPLQTLRGSLPSGRYADETEYVHAMAAQYPNLLLQLIRQPQGQFYLDEIGKFFDAAEAPLRNASNRPWVQAIHERAKLCGSRILLSGAAGNLTISWNGQALIPQLLRHGHVIQAFRESRSAPQKSFGSAVLSLIRSASPLVPEPLWLGMRSLLRRPSLDAVEPWRAYSAIAPGFAAEQHLRERAREAHHSFFPRLDLSARAQTLQERDGGAETAEGFGALTGVQKRNPANDQRIVEFCLAIPEHQFRRDGVSRSLIRRAMHGKIPVQILNNDRRGLQAADSLDRLLICRPAIYEEIEKLEECRYAREIIDLRRVRTLVDLPDEQIIGLGDRRLDYEETIEVALIAGRFIRWFQQGS